MTSTEFATVSAIQDQRERALDHADAALTGAEKALASGDLSTALARAAVARDLLDESRRLRALTH